MVWIQSSRAKPISTVRRTLQSQRAGVNRRRGRQPRRVLRRGNTRSDRAASPTRTKARTKTKKRRTWSRGRRRGPRRTLHTTEGSPNGIVPRRPVIVEGDVAQLAGSSGHRSDHWGLGRRPERHRHLLAGRKSVRLWFSLDDAGVVPADGRHPRNQRTHRSRDSPRSRGRSPQTRSASTPARVVVLLLVANVINIGAAIGAMAAALRMLLGGAGGSRRSCPDSSCRRRRSRAWSPSSARRSTLTCSSRRPVKRSKNK